MNAYIHADPEEGQRRGDFIVDEASMTTMAILDMLNGIREWFSPDGPSTLYDVITRYTQIVMSILGAHDRAQMSPANG